MQAFAGRGSRGIELTYMTVFIQAYYQGLPLPRKRVFVVVRLVGGRHAA